MTAERLRASYKSNAAEIRAYLREMSVSEEIADRHVRHRTRADRRSTQAT